MWVGGRVTALAAWASDPRALASQEPWGRRCRGTHDPTRSRERSWGRRSVHRSAKTASRSRFGALVYTVATRALRCELRRVVRAPQPPWRAGGAPLLVASLLVGKTDSARVAPPLGWHLRRGSNPHKSLMSLGTQGYTKDEKAVHRAKAPSPWICSPDGLVTLFPFKVGRDRPDSGVESRS